PEPERSEWLRELIARDREFRVEEGDAPGRGEYLDRFPEHGQLILDLFDPKAGGPGGVTATKDRGDPRDDRDPTCTFVAADAQGVIRPPLGAREEERMHEAFRIGDVLLGRYRLEEEVGKGGMGKVFRGHDSVLDRRVAIKVVLTTHAGDGNEKQRHEKAFVKEAQVWAKLAHAAIATVYDFGYKQDHPYMVLEYLAGLDARNSSMSGTRPGSESPRGIPPDPRTRAQALDSAHDIGGAHRDLKPANIKSTVEPPPDDSTFRGSSRSRLGPSAEFRLQTTQWGGFRTAAYAFPEQFTGSACDGADQFALALIVFEAVTGHRSFEGLNWGQISAVCRSPEPLEVPPTPDLPDDARFALSAGSGEGPDLRYFVRGVRRGFGLSVYQRPSSPD
ncbi:MAG: serine/threonine-protein kinase, partial [Singulisphaera sp.]